MIEVILQSFVGSQCVSVHCRARRDLFLHYRLKGFLLAVRNDFGSYFATTPKEAEDCGFVFGAVPLIFSSRFARCMFRALPPMKVSSTSISPPIFANPAIAHRQPNAVEHKPRRLLRHSESAGNFVGTDTVLAVHQITTR